MATMVGPLSPPLNYPSFRLHWFKTNYLTLLQKVESNSPSLYMVWHLWLISNNFNIAKEMPAVFQGRLEKTNSLLAFALMLFLSPYLRSPPPTHREHLGHLEATLLERSPKIVRDGMELQMFQTPSVFMCLPPDVPVVSFQIISCLCQSWHQIGQRQAAPPRPG